MSFTQQLTFDLPPQQSTGTPSAIIIKIYILVMCQYI